MAHDGRAASAAVRSAAVRVVVTGATGFIGRRLRRVLAEHGHAVFATARSAGQPGEACVSWLTCDVADHRFVDVLPDTADAIVHLAQAGATSPGDPMLRAVNVTSTELLLEYSRRAGVKRFLLASSGSVYGGSPSPLEEDRPPRPPDAYAQSKVEAEALLDQAAADVGGCALRLFAPYGPGQDSRLIADLIERVSSNRPVTLRGEGHPRLNPIFVDDLTAIVARALETEVPPILNVAGDEVLSIRDMATAIGEALGLSPRFEHVPGEPPPDLVADTALLRRTLELGKLTPFERGIATTVDSWSGRSALRIPKGPG